MEYNSLWRNMEMIPEFLALSYLTIFNTIIFFNIRELPTNSYILPMCSTPYNTSVNPFCAKFFRGNIYLHFMSLLHIDMTHVLKIFP